MVKNLLSLFLIGTLAISASAETATIDYTFAQNNLFAYGKGKKEAIDVAICINNPGLAGKKLTGFKAYITTADGISSTSLWLSKELTLENKVNAPDVLSVDVTPVAATVGEYNLQVLETTLAEPYVLTEEPLYVGYSMTVTDNATVEQKNPIVLSEGVNENGFFLHMKQSVLKWMDYSATANGVAFIVAQLEGEYPEYSLGFQNYKTIYAQEGEEFAGIFNVSNIGVNPVTSIDYSYTVDNGSDVLTGNVNLDSPIQPSLTASIPVSFNFAGISGVGPHTLNVEITGVNGMPNQSTGATIEAIVNVIPFVPVHRPLVEEFTGTWCGWCTRGYLAMEMIAEDYGDDVVAIAYHNGDPMQVTTDTPVSIGGYPSASLNRYPSIDPYYGSNNYEFGISLDIEKSMDELAIADIDINASLDGDVINVTSNVSFIQNIDNANYQVGYVLVSNGLKGQTWVQSNYYSGESGYAGTPLEILTTWPSNVAGLTFNDVAIEVSGMRGIAGSIPSTIVAGQAYSNDYTIDIAGNELVQNIEDLVVTAFIIDKSNGFIINANKCPFSKFSGVQSISDKDGLIIKSEYFDLSGRRVNNPEKGIFIKRSTLSNGSVITNKVVR